MKTVIYTAEARAEYDTAADRFAAISTKVGEAFIDEIEAVEARISESPTQFPVWEIDSGYRKAVLPEKPFRYVIYFEEIDSDTILIMAVAHGARKPGYWLRRP